MSINVMNGCLFLSVGSWFALSYLPVRFGIVIGLWGAFLSHDEFIASLGKVVFAKLRDIDREEVKTQVR
jgi:hypothetical protein